MKSLARCLRVDLERSMKSTRFLVSVVGFSILLCLNLPIDSWPEEAPYLFSLIESTMGRSTKINFKVGTIIISAASQISQKGLSLLMKTLGRTAYGGSTAFSV